MEVRSAATGVEVGHPTGRRASRTAATKYKARSAAASILVLDCRSLPASTSVQVGLRAVVLEPVFWVEVGLGSLGHSHPPAVVQAPPAVVFAVVQEWSWCWAL